jgi:hypothetical protein
MEVTGMTGPFHYSRAEQMVEEAERNRDPKGEIPDRYRGLLDAAQVHATLALAAAAAVAAVGTADVARQAWADATGTAPSGEIYSA